VSDTPSENEEKTFLLPMLLLKEMLIFPLLSSVYHLTSLLSMSYLILY